MSSCLKKSIKKCVAFLLALIITVSGLIFTLPDNGIWLKAESAGNYFLPTATGVVQGAGYEHGGVDIHCAKGTPIYAVASGTLTYSEWGHVIDYGNPIDTRYSVKIKLDEPISYGGYTYISAFYTHMSSVTYTTSSHKGIRINKGDLIGYSGYGNGVSHLHFSFETGGSSNYHMAKTTDVCNILGLSRGQSWNSTEESTGGSVTEKPTEAWITSDKSSVPVGEEVKFNFGATSAEWYVVGIYHGGENSVINNGSDTWYTATFSEPGVYSVHAAIYNCLGHADTRNIDILVYDSAPTGAWITSDKSSVPVGEEVKFNFGATSAEWYVVGIYHGGENSVINNGSDTWYTATFSEPGVYSVHAAIYNCLGHADTRNIDILVYDSAPTEAWITSDKSSVPVGEEVKFNFGATSAEWYVVGIYHGGENSVINNGSDTWYTATFSEPGVYSVHAAIYNCLGHIDSQTINIVVHSTEPINNIFLDRSEIIMAVNMKEKINARLLQENSCEIIIWESTNDQVVSVDSIGTVTAHSPGTADITATAGGVSAVCTVTVTAPESVDYDVTPNINGGASKLYEPWGLRYFAVYTGADTGRIADRGIAILKDAYYTDDMTAAEFCSAEKAHVFTESAGELGFEAPSASNPVGRYYATLTEGIYSYDIGAYYYVVPFAVMENGQIEYGTIKKNSMENILKSNLQLPSISAAEKAVCTCILELKESVAAHYAATGVPGASIDMVIPRGDSQSAAQAVRTPAQSGVTPNIVAGASRLIEPWGLRYFASYTESDSIADRGVVILCDKYYDAAYASNQDSMRLNSGSYVFTESDGTLLYDSATARYYATLTEGISSKDIADVYYVVPYVVLNDGSYVYGTVKSNSMMKIMNVNLGAASVSATEKAVSQDIIDLYNAVKAYYES